MNLSIDQVNFLLAWMEWYSNKVSPKEVERELTFKDLDAMFDENGQFR